MVNYFKMLLDGYYVTFADVLLTSIVLSSISQCLSNNQSKEHLYKQLTDQSETFLSEKNERTFSPYHKGKILVTPTHIFRAALKSSFQYQRSPRAPPDFEVAVDGVHCVKVAGSSDTRGTINCGSFVGISKRSIAMIFKSKGVVIFKMFINIKPDPVITSFEPTKVYGISKNDITFHGTNLNSFGGLLMTFIRDRVTVEASCTTPKANFTCAVPRLFGPKGSLVTGNDSFVVQKLNFTINSHGYPVVSSLIKTETILSAYPEPIFDPKSPRISRGIFYITGTGLLYGIVPRIVFKRELTDTGVIHSCFAKREWDSIYCSWYFEKDGNQGEWRYEVWLGDKVVQTGTFNASSITDEFITSGAFGTVFLPFAVLILGSMGIVGFNYFNTKAKPKPNIIKI